MTVRSEAKRFVERPATAVRAETTTVVHHTIESAAWRMHRTGAAATPELGRGRDAARRMFEPTGRNRAGAGIVQRTLVARGVPSGAKELDLAALLGQISSDLHRGIPRLTSLTPAVTFYGGARFRPESAQYGLAKATAVELAAQGRAVRTGAGPGIMGAGAEGAALGAARCTTANGRDLRPQGFNIKLEREQARHPAIVHGEEIEQFLIRKIMLYENSVGHVFFPGGYGTLDELFEVWSATEQRRLRNPLVMASAAFWSPIKEILERVALEERQLIDPKSFRLMGLADNAESVSAELQSATSVEPFVLRGTELRDRLIRDCTGAVTVLASLPEAVTVVGGRRLKADDPAVAAVADVATGLTKAGLPLRVGGAGAAAEATRRGVKLADPSAEPQAFLLERHAAEARRYGLRADLVVEDEAVHKQFLGLRSRGIVALPGGLGTLNELFGALCQIQCKKLEPMPIVLIGKSYWEPIFDVLKKQLLDIPEPTINAEDLKLVTITDDPAEALRKLSSGAG